jgi:hypothetical protein
MKIKLLRDARIKHYAGEVVEASPAEAHFLVSIGSAVPAARGAAKEEAETPEAEKPKAETPEKPKRTRKK